MADHNQQISGGQVVIVGAGFAGTLQAINLLRHEGPRATLIERRPQAGRGVAYSAAHPDLLLNVRATNMSALPDDPDHFVRWLAARHPGLTGFVPRMIYGDYLAALLDEAVERSGNRLTLVEGDACDVDLSPGAAKVMLADGRSIAADTVILAPGNLPPHAPPPLADAGLDADHYIADPWSGDVAASLGDSNQLLIIGTGLTMVDVVLMLDARGFQGKIIAMSRRGLMPQAHADAPPPPRLPERPPITPTALLAEVRSLAGAIGWRPAVDALRPFTQNLWLAASSESRRRFLRHLRPWWDIHRHRLSPQVAAKLADLRARGTLRVVAGKLLDATEAGVRWRPRGGDAIETLQVRRIINCSGPQGDLLRTTEPLLRRLLDRGLLRPDAQRLGIDVNPQSEAISASGTADPRLIVLGPMTRGTFWEIVAVPDIRVQTWSVARRLSNAHWVGGEGL